MKITAGPAKVKDLMKYRTELRHTIQNLERQAEMALDRELGGRREGGEREGFEFGSGLGAAEETFNAADFVEVGHAGGGVSKGGSPAEARRRRGRICRDGAAAPLQTPGFTE